MSGLSRKVFFLALFFLNAGFVSAFFYHGEGWYESSIYLAFPWIFWLFILLAFAGGIVSVLLSIFREPNSYFWGYGLLVLILGNTFILLLPYLRHYAFTSVWDPIGHYSYTLNFLQKGVPANGDFYPASHAQLAAFTILGGIDLHNIILLFPLFIYLIYLSNIAFAGWTLWASPAVRGLAMLLAVPLVYQTFTTTFRPTHIAIIVIPLLVGLLVQKQSSWHYRLLAIIVILFLPFLHPWGVLAALILFFSYGVGSLLLWRKGWSASNNITLILLIVWFIWFTTFSVFGKTVRRLVESFLLGLSGDFNIGAYVEKANHALLPLEKVLSLIVFTYGTAILYSGMVLIIFLLAVVAVRQRRLEKLDLNQVSLMIFCIVFLVISLLSLFRDIFTEGPLRTVNFILALVPLLAAKPLLDHWTVLVSRRRRNVAAAGLAGFIFCTMGLGIFNSYSSPLMGQANIQMSYAQEAGIRTLIATLPDDGAPILSPFGGASFVLTSMDYDLYEETIRSDPRWKIDNIPTHFDFHTEPDNYAGSIVLLSAFERSYYYDVWPEGGSFTRGEFDVFLLDPHLNIVYSDRDFFIGIWDVMNAQK